MRIDSRFMQKLAGFVCAFALLAVPAAAQPLGGWLTFDDGYVEVPYSPALNPTQGFTFEAWVRIQDDHGCSSIAGQDWTETWWIGVCGTGFRSYLKGSTSRFDAGTIPPNVWTHIAVTFDGTTRRHYINGIQVGERAETAPLTNGTGALRIGSDISWEFIPTGSIDEVRLWNVARTAAQLQANRNATIGNATQGLVAVWSFNGNLRDSVGGNHGTAVDDPTLNDPAPPAGSWLTTSALPGFQFKVRITAGGTTITGVRESDCVQETLCVSGAVPGRSEVFVRVVGPRPNGFLWPNVVKFTPSQVEVWIQQTDTGAIQYYLLPGSAPDSDELPGLFDRTGFLP